MILKTMPSTVWLKVCLLLSVCTLIAFASDAQGQKARRGGNEVFTAVDHPASFPGGEMAFSNYLKKNIRYPQEARDMKIHGKVDLTFVVEKNGTLSDIKVVHGLGSGCDQEAVRVLKASPKWRPARQKGHIVRQQYNLPIRFWVSRV